MSSYFCNKHTVTQDRCIDANIDISFDFLTILRAVRTNKVCYRVLCH